MGNRGVIVGNVGSLQGNVRLLPGACPMTASWM
jgi:hypothetical protein